MRSPVVELLADLADALDGAEVPWFLFGAQAAILHGAARLTADVDVTVRLPEGMSTNALVERLERHRFRARIADPVFIERTRVIPFAHAPTELPLDIVLAGPGLEDEFFRRTQEREIDGILIRVASPEDVVVMKVLAGRPKDDEDVVAVVKAYGDKLDVRYIEHMLDTLEQALSQSDLRPALRRALARANRR